jgi:hypothetical protein
MSSRIGRSGPDFRGRATAAPGKLRRVWRAAQALVICGLLVLMALAVWFQLDGAWRAAMLGGLVCITAGCAALWRKSMDRALWIGVAVLLLGAGAWYGSLRPTNDGDWAPEVAHGVTGTIGTDTVTLHNIRDFHWATAADFSPHWEDRTYRLSDLRTMDLISSVWASPSIAHTLVSFGFADGRHVVFSAEIRRHRDQAYSSLGGFFRMFDLVLIAADERDIVRLRTDVRGEWVSLFALDIPPEQIRGAFLSFVTLGNELADHPRFYNTLTTNCTTVVWRLARSISPGLPLDWRVLVSGHLPDYLHDLGVLAPGMPLDEVLARARRSPLGPAEADSVAFSARLRAPPIAGWTR